MGWATYVFAAPAFHSVPGVTVTPSKAYTGDSIQITLDGLPPGLSIPGGSVTLAGKRLSVPGVLGAAGIQPIADNLGKISFTTKIPLDMPYGSSELAVGNLPYGEIRTTTFKVLAAEVTFSPTSSSPNETVTLRGLGFSPSTSFGGNGPLGVHQITGQGKSGIKVNGKLLEWPYVKYPIDLDSDGVLTATIILPESYVTAPGSRIEVKVIDDAERSGVGAWSVKNRVITVTPAESGRGSALTVTGSGFAGTSRYNNLCTTVDLTYAGVLIKQAIPDAIRSFTTVIKTPNDVAISSTNTISVTTAACPMVAAVTAKHKISARSLTISPGSSVTSGRVTITGVSYLGYTPISLMTIGGISVLPSPAPFVDAGGNFSVDVALPVLTTGLQTVSVTAGGVQSTVKLVVVSTAISPTSTPTPIPTTTPTPTPAVTATAAPAVAAGTLLAPLGDNLVVVWSYDRISRSWQFFTTNPGFASKNQLSTMVADQVYWLRVKETQTVRLNGRQRNVAAGWTLIHW